MARPKNIVSTTTHKFDELLFQPLVSAMEKNWVENKTFERPPTVADLAKLDPLRAALLGIKTGKSVILKGDPGVGKTSMLRNLYTSLGYRVWLVSAPNTSTEAWAVPFPLENEDGTRSLAGIFDKNLSTGEPLAVILDELGKAEPGYANNLMEFLADKTWQGQPINGLMAIAATDNFQSNGTRRTVHMDAAQSSRFLSVNCSVSNTGWWYALAQKFPRYDLNEMIARMCAGEILISPRVVDAMLTVAINGGPLAWGIPFDGDNRMVIKDSNGKDITQKNIEAVARTSGVPYLTEADVADRKVDLAVKISLDTGGNLLMVGPPGIAKTSYIKDLINRHGYNLESLSSNGMAPEDIFIPFPRSANKPNEVAYIEPLLAKRFIHESPWVLHMADFSRMQRSTMNAFMSILQERYVGGIPLDNLKSVIADTNPRVPVSGERLEVIPIDPAVASRFGITINVEFTDFPIYEFLLAKYGEAIADPVIRWHKEVLDAPQAYYANARVLDSIMGILENSTNFTDLLYAIPTDEDGTPVPVPINVLIDILEKRELPRLKMLAENIDKIEKILLAGKAKELKEEERTDYELTTQILVSLRYSQYSQLVTYRDAIVRLVHALPRRFITPLVQAETGVNAKEIRKYWIEVILEAYASEISENSAKLLEG
jgi:MoxR-like ATPase